MHFFPSVFMAPELVKNTCLEGGEEKHSLEWALVEMEMAGRKSRTHVNGIKATGLCWALFL